MDVLVVAIVEYFEEVVQDLQFFMQILRLAKTLQNILGETEYNVVSVVADLDDFKVQGVAAHLDAVFVRHNFQDFQSLNQSLQVVPVQSYNVHQILVELVPIVREILLDENFNHFEVKRIVLGRSLDVNLHDTLFENVYVFLGLLHQVLIEVPVLVKPVLQLNQRPLLLFAVGDVALGEVI